MTNRERENITLSFGNPVDRGSVEETFYPWTLTVERFKNEGLPDCISKGLIDSDNDSKGDDYEFEKYLGVNWGGGAFNYESYLGFDPVRRVSFELPFRVYEEATLEDTAEYSIKMNTGGRQIKHHKVSGLKEKSKHIVSSEEDWKRLKEYGEKKLEKFYTNENIKKAYLRLKEGHDRGDYPIRLSIEGFFWTPRELLGIEPHLYAFYDAPELIHDMNEYILKVYLDKLADVLEVLPAEVLMRMRDEIRLELARAKVGYSGIKIPLENFAIFKRIPINDALTEDSFIAKLEEVEAALNAVGAICAIGLREGATRTATASALQPASPQ